MSLVPHQPQRFPEQWALPELSPTLRQCVGVIAHHYLWDIWTPITDYPDHVTAQAVTALEDVNIQFATRISEERLLEWLSPMLPSLRNTRSPSELDSWFSGAAFLLIEEIPACLFTRAALREAMKEIVFFPAAGDIYKVLAPYKARMGEYRSRLERIIRASKERP